MGGGVKSIIEQGTTFAQGVLKCVRGERGEVKKNSQKPSTYYLHVPSHDTGCLDATKQHFLVAIVSAMLLYIPNTHVTIKYETTFLKARGGNKD